MTSQNDKRQWAGTHFLLVQSYLMSNQYSDDMRRMMEEGSADSYQCFLSSHHLKQIKGQRSYMPRSIPCHIQTQTVPLELQVLGDIGLVADRSIEEAGQGAS